MLREDGDRLKVTVAEEQPNVALVTKTLVQNSAALVAQSYPFTLELFMDFCSLCEATIILDELHAIESSDALTAFPLTSRLSDAGVLREFRPKVAREDVKRAVLRLPEALSRRVLPTFWERSSEWERTDSDVRGHSVLTESGAVRGMAYDVEVKELMSQLDAVVTYPSLERSDEAAHNRVLRSNGYLVVAAVNGLDYYPDFDRAPFVAATVRSLYRSLPRQLYERVADSLGEAGTTKEELLTDWTLDSVLPIPPASAMVLQSSRSLEDVPAALIEVRKEFSRYRQYFRQFRAALRSADTLKERRRVQEKYKELLAVASGADRELVSTTEVLNFAESVVKVAASPGLPTSYSGRLIAQPVEWVQRWWRQRPIAILFRLDSKMPRISEYATLIDRLWGERVHEDLITQYKLHSVEIEKLLSSR